MVLRFCVLAAASALLFGCPDSKAGAPRAGAPGEAIKPKTAEPAATAKPPSDTAKKADDDQGGW